MTVDGGNNKTEVISTHDHERQDQKFIGDETRKRWELEQKEMKEQIILEDDRNGFTALGKNNLEKELRYIGAVDISFCKEDSSKCVACLVICEYPTMTVLYEDYEYDTRITQPYIPGFLAFREVPVYLPLFERVAKDRSDISPQILMVDGNGILHTRGFGLACHLGVLLDLPTVGCAKSPFAVDGMNRSSIQEKCQRELKHMGDYTLLEGESGQIWGAALRATNESIRPIYVSVGHRMTLQTAIAIVKLTLDKFRIPEPIRQADLRGRTKIRELEAIDFKKNEGDVLII